MSQQQRWFCRQCAREWVYAYNWSEADGCPRCHGADIDLVTYRPRFPGDDIPRAPEVCMEPVLPPVVEQRTGPLTMVDDFECAPI